VFPKAEFEDYDFIVHAIAHYPKYRPHQINSVITIVREYIENETFRKLFIEKCSKICPVLVFLLNNHGLIRFDEVIDELKCPKNLLLCYYFHNQIEDFASFIAKHNEPAFSDKQFLNDTENLDAMIQYGFLPSSVEYCLKYDDISSLKQHLIDPMELKRKKTIEWCPFEWTERPDIFGQAPDLLSFAGLFGSIECFKMLMLNGFPINQTVTRYVCASGSFDLFHLCYKPSMNLTDLAAIASQYGQIEILRYLIEQKAPINDQDHSWCPKTPLQCAAHSGLLFIVDFLINEKSNPNGPNMRVFIGFLMKLRFTLPH